jgi:hypothetical protein
MAEHEKRIMHVVDAAHGDVAVRSGILRRITVHRHPADGCDAEVARP